MKKLRVGVIGVGYLGRFHAEKYANMENVDLVGVVDVIREKADATAANVGTVAYQNHRDLFGKVDAVSIVVPTPAHFSVGLDFLEHGVDVLIEKPLTARIEEADELIRVADTQNLILQVGHLERFNPAIVALQDIVKNPMFIESHRLSIFKDRSTDVSVVLDLMIHDIDIILNFVRSELKAIHAAGVPVIGEHVDIANVRLEFENGCVANVTASRISAKDQRKIRMFQKDGYISVDFAKHEIMIIRRDEKGTSNLIPGMDIRQITFSDTDALDDELKAFVDAVLKREAPKVTGQVGRRALKTALIIMEQIQQRMNQYLDA
jgi:predicted dehydrogenase